MPLSDLIAILPELIVIGAALAPAVVQRRVSAAQTGAGT